MTAFDDMPTVVSAMRDGAVEFLVKPLDLRQLCSVTRRVFEDRQLARTRVASRRADRRPRAGLVGRDPRMIADLQARRPGGGDARDGADPRRERHGQGAGRARDPRQLDRRRPSRSCR